MIRLLALALLLLAAPVAAQDDGLVDGHLLNSESSPEPPSVERPQLVHHNHALPIIVGTSAAVVGGISLVASWSVYFARTSYRMRSWSSLSNDTVSSFSEMGAWSLYLGIGASTLIVTSEALLLPESTEVPTLAWFGGVGGLVLAAVGVGFAVGGEHCGPQILRPGADIRLACSAPFADAVAGPLMLLTSAPLISLPLVYLFRKAFAGAPESLSLGPGSIQLSGRF